MKKKFCEHCGNEKKKLNETFHICELCFKASERLAGLIDKFSYPNDSFLPIKSGQLIVEWIEKLSLRNLERIRELQERIEVLEHK